MLYLIPTPIGNLEDITMRALRLMRELPIFLCEDTRTTKGLMTKYEIDYRDKKFFSYTGFTQGGRLDSYIQMCQEHDVGLMSDAGTPGLSDPGKIIIDLCTQHSIPFTVLPGANSLIPAVVSSNFPTHHFMFYGFLPTKKGRQTCMNHIITNVGCASFFLESVHRITKTLQQLKDMGFVGSISIAREISKMHEQLITASIDDVILACNTGTIVSKGEFVVGCRVDKVSKK